eukprot:scaffold96599_cov31-Tisochrysis_lutea.AAC.1
MDSRVHLPPIFDARAIKEAQAAAAARSGLEVQSVSGEVGGAVGAVLSGPFALDTTINILLERQRTCGRSGGMSTAGTQEDPHVIVVTDDGCSLSRRESAVRLAVFPATTEFLAQSAGDVSNLACWRASKLAESWATVKVQCLELRPAFCRLYRNGQLMPGGQACNPPVYVAIAVVADLPAIRKLGGYLQHTHDCFGPPFCNCHAANMFNFNEDPETHYGAGLDYEEEANKHHTPLWAMGGT